MGRAWAGEADVSGWAVSLSLPASGKVDVGRGGGQEKEGQTGPGHLLVVAGRLWVASGVPGSQAWADGQKRPGGGQVADGRGRSMRACDGEGRACEPVGRNVCQFCLMSSWSVGERHALLSECLCEIMVEGQ
ncbi:hypothetical protein TNCT_300051, partial [Trichonephila clavata]